MKGKSSTNHTNYCEVTKAQCPYWKGRFIGCTSPTDCQENTADGFARSCLATTPPAAENLARAEMATALLQTNIEQSNTEIATLRAEVARLREVAAGLAEALRATEYAVQDWMSYGNACPLCRHHYKHGGDCPHKQNKAALAAYDAAAAERGEGGV